MLFSIQFCRIIRPNLFPSPTLFMFNKGRIPKEETFLQSNCLSQSTPGCLYLDLILIRTFFHKYWIEIEISSVCVQCWDLLEMRRFYYIRMEFLPPSVTSGLCTEGPDGHKLRKVQLKPQLILEIISVFLQSLYSLHR